MTPQTLAHILVFKTKVESNAEFTRLADILNNVPGIRTWNLDREDVDKVLRVVTDELTAEEVITLLGRYSMFCEELPD